MNWFGTTPEAAAAIILSTIAIYAIVVLLTRLNGLRTYSKMSSFDFAITVAVGTLVASTALTRTTTVIEGTIAMAVLFGCQRVVSWARYHRDASEVVDNEPVLLMVGDTMFEEVLAASRVTRDDVYAKLREANVLDFDEVQAVVLESTGDISVLHGEAGRKRLNPALLRGVRGGERLESGGDAPDPREAGTP